MTFRYQEQDTIRVAKLNDLAEQSATPIGGVYTVAQLQAREPAMGQDVYCSDEVGGFVRVFADGQNWRRITDRAIISA